jgi:putative membrane protein
MATADARQRLRERPIGATVLLTIVGYALVIGTFTLELPIYPDLTNAQVNVFTHAIAVINAVTTALLVAGWYWIRTGQVEKHRVAMTGAFATIILFLVVYLIRVGGGGEKLFVGGPDLVYYAYLIMLAVHIVLSIVAVPVVLYALILGLTHTPTELRDTAHARVGRIAAGSWILSLVLGIVTYLMLNHIYDYEFAMLVPLF